MKEVGLTEGEDVVEAAFNTGYMSEKGVNAYDLMDRLLGAVLPFSAYLKDGYGFAVTRDGDNGSIIGIKINED